MQLCCLLLSIVSKMYILKRRRKYIALKCDKVVHTRHNGLVSYIMWDDQFPFDVWCIYVNTIQY